MTADKTISKRDLARARRCLECPVCSRGRQKQRGFFYWIVKRVEGGVCPYCKAYEKVYGRKAHAPLSEKK